MTRARSYRNAEHLVGALAEPLHRAGSLVPAEDFSDGMYAFADQPGLHSLGQVQGPVAAGSNAVNFAASQEQIGGTDQPIGLPTEMNGGSQFLRPVGVRLRVSQFSDQTQRFTSTSFDHPGLHMPRFRRLLVQPNQFRCRACTLYVEICAVAVFQMSVRLGLGTVQIRDQAGVRRPEPPCKPSSANAIASR